MKSKRDLTFTDDTSLTLNKILDDQDLMLKVDEFASTMTFQLEVEKQ